MRADNLILLTVCLPAVALAVAISWRGRHLPITAPPASEPTSVRVALADAVRTVASLLAAASVAGVLVAGFGGRLLMRTLAATSPDDVQGRLTEADETIGQITFSGTFFFIVFIGLVFPVAAVFPYLLLRPVLPTSAWAAGAVSGTLLLAAFAAAEPVSTENPDFTLLTPHWLAVVLVAAVALLYGTTFAALAARFDASAPPLMGSRGDRRRRGYATYASLVWLAVPHFFVFAATYVGARAAVRGRARTLLERAPVQLMGRVTVAGTLALSALVVGAAAVDVI